MHFYLLITAWYALTFKLSVEFMRRAYHLWFLLIFYDDVYRWQISPPCLGSRQIILNTSYVPYSLSAIKLLRPWYLSRNPKSWIHKRIRMLRSTDMDPRRKGVIRRPRILSITRWASFAYHAHKPERKKYR